MIRWAEDFRAFSELMESGLPEEDVLDLSFARILIAKPASTFAEYALGNPSDAGLQPASPDQSDM
jgi:hypothetical protein